jgi:hypothetical protein
VRATVPKRRERRERGPGTRNKGEIREPTRVLGKEGRTM